MELYNQFENLLSTLYLGEPAARGTLGAVLFSIPILFHWPISYTQVSDGIYMPRAWSLLSPEDESATAFPWYIFPILGALLFGLFL